jgi:hypothetical protein
MTGLHTNWPTLRPAVRLESVHAADDAVAIQGKAGGRFSRHLGASEQTLFTVDRRAVRCRGVSARGEQHAFIPLGDVSETVFELRQSSMWNPLLALMLLVLGLSQGLLAEPSSLYWLIGLPMSVLGGLLLAFHLMSRSVVKVGVITGTGRFHGISVRANKDQVESLRRASTHLDTLVENGQVTGAATAP